MADTRPLSLRVSVLKEVVVAARTIARGLPLRREDLTVRNEDLAGFSRPYLTSPDRLLVMKPDKMRHRALRAVDLARETAPTGKPYEITEVVPPAMFNIQPADYLPVRAVA